MALLDLFRRKDQPTVTLDRRDLEEAILSAMRRMDAEREAREKQAFADDGVSVALRWIFAFIFLFSALVCFWAGGVLLLSCFDRYVAFAAEVKGTPAVIRAFVSFVFGGYGCGSLVLFWSVRKTQSRVLMLSYSSLFVAMISLIIMMASR